MLKPIFALCLLFFTNTLFSQKQLELISHLDYVSLANDVWGYTAPDGTEYALIGLRSGVSVVSLADPANPVEIQLVPGDMSTWRDIQTWGEYAYVTCDQPGTDEGLLVIDLSELPNAVTWENWRPLLPGQIDTLHTCHTLWIDDIGYCYLSGCDQNSGGIIILDVFSQPGQPQFVGFSGPTYAHDCFAQNGKLYTAEIYAGQFSVFDITNPQSPVLLATQKTPFEFCHNVWVTADGNTLFATDERANAPVSAYDISDLDNIKLLDEFRPIATLNTGVISHNAYVKGNHVVISNYTDGVIIVDATQPDNLIEVESFDTNTDFESGFHGCWAAYPYFPSGLIAASDIENGLFILKPTYPRVAYLEGKVTDGVTGLPITSAEVEILSDDANFATTSFTGDYKTGQATAGTFKVLFHAKGYFDLELQATLVGGEVTILNAQMLALPAHSVTGVVTDELSNTPIADAAVFLENEDFNYTGKTDANGVFELTNVLHGQYCLYIGQWGYQNLADSLQVFTDDDHSFTLARGYEDDFNNDLGWQVDGTADNGIWERGKPLGIRAANKQFTPDGDSPDDAGNHAYVTGNQGIFVHDDQVDNGETRLSSPPMQLRSRYNRPLLQFDYWWYDAISNNAANDSMMVYVTNGTDTQILGIYDTDADNVQAWQTSDTFDLASYVPLTDDVRIRFVASDRSGTPNVVEAGLDNFRIWDKLPDEIFTISDNLASMRIYPNPSANLVTVDYKIEVPFQRLSLEVANVLGQTIMELYIGTNPTGTLTLDLTNEVAAPYFIFFRVDGKISKAAKLMKVID